VSKTLTQLSQEAASRLHKVKFSWRFTRKGPPVIDLLFVLLTLAFFAAGWGYALACGQA
jgi:hypothetical protein